MQLFLSHSKVVKKNLVVPFSNDLSTLDCPFWLDRITISSGEDIDSRIIDGINSSSHCIAFIDDAYLHGEWTLREIELFRQKEIQTGGLTIIPIYCSVTKEAVYEILPWLKNRAFEEIRQSTYDVGERERIICRVINRLLVEIGASADISILEQILLNKSTLLFYDLFNILYDSKYYLSFDLRLSCIELCNILALLSVVYNTLDISKEGIKRSLFKMPSYIKKIALNNPNYLDFDFIVVLKRCINCATVDLLRILNS